MRAILLWCPFQNMLILPGELNPAIPRLAGKRRIKPLIALLLRQKQYRSSRFHKRNLWQRWMNPLHWLNHLPPIWAKWMKYGCDRILSLILMRNLRGFNLFLLHNRWRNRRGYNLLLTRILMWNNLHGCSRLPLLKPARASNTLLLMRARNTLLPMRVRNIRCFLPPAIQTRRTLTYSLLLLQPMMETTNLRRPLLSHPRNGIAQSAKGTK